MQYRLLPAALVVWHLLVALLLLHWAGPARAAALPDPPALVLDGSAPRVEAWPALSVLAEDGPPLTAAQAFDAASRFTPPPRAQGTLGLQARPQWLRLALDIPVGSPPGWILDVGYPPLQSIEVHLAVLDPAGAPRWVQQARLGSVVPVAERALSSRTHALPLALEAGARHIVLLRVETAGAMILPITLSSPADFHARALREQMLQGVLGGLGLFLLIYSLVQWTSLREPLFGKYALLVTGSLWFSALQFGIGAQYLWPGNAWMEQHSGVLSALTAACGSFLFIEHVLFEPGRRRLFSRFMKAGATLCVVLAAAYALGLLGMRAASAVVSVLGLVPALAGVPGAIARARRGDAVGASFLVAWAIYFAATAVIVGVINGGIDATPWTLHAFQIGATLDMLIFMRVVGMRMRDVQAAARRAALEHESLRSLAHTDPLTGLPNRRGLQAALAAALPDAAPGHLLALYMLDLDGFKPVNDQHGHDVGDELLAAVAKRLRDSVRSTDLVTRLGGDEFVVMISGLPSEQRAAESAQHWVEAFRRPFQLRGRTCAVGLTVGYALAPLDGTDPVELLKRADAAMYAGKQDGKGCARRARPGEPAPVLEAG